MRLLPPSQGSRRGLQGSIPPAAGATPVSAFPRGAPWVPEFCCLSPPLTPGDPMSTSSSSLASRRQPQEQSPSTLQGALHERQAQAHALSLIQQKQEHALFINSAKTGTRRESEEKAKTDHANVIASNLPHFLGTLAECLTVPGHIFASGNSAQQSFTGVRPPMWDARDMEAGTRSGHC